MKYATRAAVPLLLCTAAVSAAQTHIYLSAALAVAQTPAPPHAAPTVAQTPAPPHAAPTVAQTPAPSHAAPTVAQAHAPPSAAPTAAQTHTPRAATDAVVEQPRLTGYFVGDLLTQRVLLQRDGQPFTPATLPANGRVSAWFERRGTTVVTDAALHRWLVVEYQILNAPPKLTDVTLPAWQLTAAPSAGGSPATLRIPSVLINVAPLSPPGSPEQVGTRDLRPDRISPVIPIAPIRRELALASSALALTLLAWVAWVVWRNRRAVATQPFARALREMRTLDDREPRAWQALHRAFDRTAGRVIQSTTLPALFAKAPQLTPARPQIEAFFQQSSLLFFGGATATADATQVASASSGPATASAPPRRPIASADTGPSSVAHRTAAPDSAIASAAAGPSPMVPRSAAPDSAAPGRAIASADRALASGTTGRSSAVPRSVAVPAEPVSTSPDLATSLPHALCIELRRIERRHES
jgi:mxaA protein